MGEQPTPFFFIIISFLTFVYCLPITDIEDGHFKVKNYESSIRENDRVISLESTYTGEFSVEGPSDEPSAMDFIYGPQRESDYIEFSEKLDEGVESVSENLAEIGNQKEIHRKTGTDRQNADLGLLLTYNGEGDESSKDTISSGNWNYSDDEYLNEKTFEKGSSKRRHKRFLDWLGTELDNKISPRVHHRRRRPYYNSHLQACAPEDRYYCLNGGTCVFVGVLEVTTCR